MVKLRTVLAAVVAVWAFVGLSAAGSAQPRYTAEQADADWTRLDGLLRELRPALEGESAYLSGLPNIETEQGRQRVRSLQAFVAQQRAPLLTELRAILTRAGAADARELERAIVTPLGGFGAAAVQQRLSTRPRPAQAWTQLFDAANGAEPLLQRVFAGEIAAARNMISVFTGESAEARSTMSRQILPKLETLAALDPNNREVAQLINEVRGATAAAVGDLEQEVRNRRFPAGHVAFAGPGTADALAEAAGSLMLREMRQEFPQADYQLHAVRVHGTNWIVAKRDAFNRPTQYGVEFGFLMSTRDDRTAGRARMFTGILLATEGPNPQQSLPFVGWRRTSDAAFMLLANAPSGGGVGSLPGGGGGGLWALIAQLLQLALVLATVAAGLAAAGSFIAVRLPQVPQLQLLNGRIAPLAPAIGAGAVAVGLLSFVWSLVHLAPFASLLTQLVAIVVGLLLGADLIRSRMAAQASASPAVARVAGVLQGQMDAQRERLQALDAVRGPLGIAAIVLGILHLVVPGLPLI